MIVPILPQHEKEKKYLTTFYFLTKSSCTTYGTKGLSMKERRKSTRTRRIK
jgi:hypothetical protein